MKHATTADNNKSPFQTITRETLTEKRMRHMRTQNDEKGDTVSRMTALNCSDSKDMTRQEFKADVDVNNIINKFGVTTQNRAVKFGENDFTMDLQNSLTAIQHTAEAHKKLNPELRKRYPSWQALVNAIHSGELAKDLEKMGHAHKTAEEAKATPKTEEKPK